jgi:type I restriction-modification system DNA methylase subunit
MRPTTKIVTKEIWTIGFQAKLRINPIKGRIYDPTCGSGPTRAGFVQSEKLVETHGGKLGEISIYGHESNTTTRRLAIMNLAIRGIEADIGKGHADTFRSVQQPDRRADYILANGSMYSNQSGEVHRISTIYPPCA